MAEQRGDAEADHDALVGAATSVPVGEVRFPDGASAGDRSPMVLDAYRRSAQVMRDTTRWVVSFVPGAGVLLALTAVVPDVAALGADRRGEPVAWLSAAGVAVVIGLVAAGRVLAAAPPRWQWIVEEYGRGRVAERQGRVVERRSLAAELDGAGFLSLWGYTSPGELFERLGRLDPDHVAGVPAPAATIVDFAYARLLRGRFVTFVVVGVSAAAVAVGCVTAAEVAVADAQRDVTPGPAAVAAPLRAVVAPTPAGRQLLDAASCELGGEDVRLGVWVVGGDLDAGRLIIDDEVCAPVAVDWEAARHGVVVPASAG